MRETNLAGVDLNLLPALEALIRRRNVTKAGEDVGLSQPAMSRALARLRDLLGDPLLVRTASGLAPTARALALLPQLAAALDQIGGVMRPAALAAEALDRLFVIAATDVQALLIGPPLWARLRREAPRARLRFAPIGADLRLKLDAGEVDLVFGLASLPLPPGAYSEPLVEDALALVTRRGARPPGHVWTREEYAAQDHATVAIFGDGVSEIDSELAQAGLARRIAFTSPQFLSTLAAVGRSDCVSVQSAALARRFADVLNLDLHDPPLEGRTLQLTVVGPATRARDPALVWLRERLKAAAAEAYTAV